MNDNKDNKEYIKGLFDDDGIKAPESLSEDSIMKMLDAGETKVGSEVPTNIEWKVAKKKDTKKITKADKKNEKPDKVTKKAEKKVKTEKKSETTKVEKTKKSVEGKKAK